MNDYVTRLLAEAAQPKTPSVLEQKQQSVAATAAQKQATMGGVPMSPAQLYAPVAAQRNGDSGTASANPMETDMRNLSAFELNTKYGDAAQQMINNRNAASNRTTVDAAVTRNWDQTAADTVSGIGMGVASGLGGMGALGLGIVNKDAGLAAAEGLNKLTEFGQSTQSEALQAKRRLLAAQNQQDQRDSTAKYENDIASGNGKFMSSLSRIGRDVLSSVGNAAVDPITLGDGVSQGVGSMIAISPVSRLLKGAGGAIEKMGTPLAIGGLEAGGSYQQSGTEVMKMSHEQLLKTSPDYAQMVLRGMDPDEARSTVANRTALTAAALTLPAAIAAGKLVDGFASNPMKLVSGKAAVGNLGKETVEEAIQGGTGQLAQNYATQINADNTKSLSEGVGEQIGTGALYGLGTAGALQAPSLALGAASKTVNAVLSKVGNFLQDRGDKVTAENEAASPASINRAVEKTTALAEVAPQMQEAMTAALAPTATDTPEIIANKQAATSKYQGFMDSLKITEAEKESQLMVPALPIIAATGSRTEAIAALVQDIRGEKNMNALVGKGVALQTLLMPFMAMPDGVDTDTLDPDAKKVFDGFLAVQNSITEAPEVMSALKAAGKFFSTAQGQALMNELNQTPESAMRVVAATQMNPESATNPDVLDVVAKMATDGTIQLNPQQMGALTSARTVMRAALDYDTRLKAAGESRPKDIVAFQVKTEDDDGRNVDGKRSALQHAEHITKLINSGDMAGAKAALELFGKFAQGQANKVAGINANFAAGRGAPRSQVNTLSAAAGFELAPSKTLVGVTPTQVNSLRFANMVTAEARFLAQIHNGLADAYRDSLGVDSLAIPELDAILQGNAADVAAEFANGKRDYPQGQKLAMPATGAAPAVVAVTSTSTPVVPVVVAPVTPAAVTPPASTATPPKVKKEPKAKVVKKPKPLTISKAVKGSKTAKLQERLNTEKRPAILEQIKAELASRQDEIAAQEEADALTEELAKAKADADKAAAVSAPVQSDIGAKNKELVIDLESKEAALSKFLELNEELDGPKIINEEHQKLLDAYLDAWNEVQEVTEAAVDRVQSFKSKYATALQERMDAINTEETTGETSVLVALLTDAVVYEREFNERQGSLLDSAPATPSAAKPAKKITPAPAITPTVSNPVQDRQNYLDNFVAGSATNQVESIKLWTERQLKNNTEALATTDNFAKVTELEASRAVLNKLLKKAESLITPAEASPPAITAESKNDEAPVFATVKEAFPNLVTPTKTEGTSLAKAFNFRKIASRFIGSGSPIAKLKESLQSFEALTAFLAGRDVKRKLTPETVDYYRERVPEMAGKLVKSMNANLNAQLDKLPKKAGGLTLRQLLAEGADVNDFVRGKVLSIAEKTVDPKTGKVSYAYNQELVEAAVLAGLDWFHNASNSGPIREEKDVAAILGIAEDDVSKEMLAAFNGGNQLLLIDVVPRIAQNITQFWGMKANNDYTQSATIGIPQAVATEVLMAMIRGKLIDWTPPVTEKTGEGADDFMKSLHVFKLNQDALANPIYAEYPSFLSEMANSEIPETMYFGDALPSVAKTQMNNADVSLTADQVKAVEAEQKTPFYINEPMFKLYQMLTKEGLLSIFGAGAVTPENRKAYNKTHLETVEGKNLSIVAAFDSLMNRSQEMTSVADAAGISLKDVAVRFAYGISRVGRMQMLGRQNPQASKLVREALMPNQSKIDLTNQDDYNGYMLSIAQMLGVKVHTISLEKSIAEVKKLMEGDLKDALLLMQKYDATGTLDRDAVTVLQASIKAAGGTFMGLHALVDYAHLQNMIEAGGMPSEYKTAVYVEADGVTNGPINAMVNLAVGKFTANWLQNVGKGGLFLTPNQTMNKHREGTEEKAADNVDLYQKSTLEFDKARKERVASLKADTADRLLKPLARLMDIFIKDVTLIDDATGELELKRGVAKNPLTITIYGSGVRGIANKVTAELLDAIYAKMSEAGLVLQANPEKSYAEAMFGSMASDNKTADSLYADFMAGVAALTEEKVIFSKKNDKYMIVGTSIEGTKADGTKSYTKVGPMAWGTPQTFKVSGPHLQSLQENMMKMFVEPLRQGIEATVGPEVMASAQMIQVATNLQSIGLATQFKVAVYEAIAKHKRPSSQFLSRNEQAAIMADLIKLYPTVKTQAQEFLISGVSQTAVKVTDFSQALAGNMSMAAAVFAPDFAGVAGSPFLNIGMGDGLMMQLMATMKNAIAGTLKIFDGINMPVDKIKEGSLQANEAVSQTWQGNPMRAVANSFRASLPHLKKIMEGANEKDPEYVAMVRSFGTLGMSDISFADGLDYVNSSIEYMADEIDARHTAMKRVRHSIDQMASAEAPYQNEGEDLSGMNEEAQLARLNEMFKEELAKLRKITMARNSNSEELSGTPENVKVVKDLSDVANIPKVTMTPEGVMTLLRKLPDDLKESARQALLSPAMRGFTVIVGPREYINELTNNELGEANGVTIFGTKTIYLTSGSPEVLVHELLHAATMEKVLGVLAGTNKDKTTVEAVNRLKILRDQFYKMEHNGALERTEAQNIAVRNAINSMRTAKARFGEGVELNEFMAWATTNEVLIELGKATTADKSALVQFTRKIIGLIRSLFFGSDYKGKLPKDFFNQVRFNNVLIARRNQPSAVAVAKDLIAYHSTAYGNDARLNEIETAYLNKMEPLFDGLPTQAYQNKIVDHATDLANAVTTSFPMSQQAKGVFQTVVGALATEATLNPASLAKAQELYNHVTKQLTVESFMNNPEVNDPADRFYAQEKHDLIMGKTLLIKDPAGRSSLMPVFLALGTVDDSFRSILAGMEMPKEAKNLGTTLDDYLRNYGNNAMDALSNQLAGTKSTDSIKEALDGLQNNIVDTAQKKVNILQMMGSKVGGWVDVANDKAVEGLGKAAVAGAKLGDRLKKSNNKYVGNAGSIIKATSGLLSNDTAEATSEGLLSAMSSREGWQPLRDFANDIIGRVGSNADIYDMIKKVRSTVSSVRQEFRENVPLRIAKEFGKDLTDQQWTDLNKAMGKTDMAALNMPLDAIKELVRNKAKMAQAIKAKEDSIKAVTGVHTPLYLAKSKQLADYMKTGVPGSNLLRNAEALARMFNEKVAKITITPDLISNMDELVSLYAIRDMDQAERTTFNDLADNAGIGFTFSYLKQQRKDETDKAIASAGSKFNHYKGYIPSVQSSGMSLIVADDTQHAKLKSMSYVLVGSYMGAGAERFPVKKSYYFSNTPTRASFNQGIVQNVNITAGGVTATHGYSESLTAGMINEPAMVAQITKRIALGAEKAASEQLMPVFGANGDVIAYERSVDPIQLQRLQKNDKLHQMLGVWRGRQIEEAMASSINDKLVDNMVEMYKKDLAAGRASEYVNIFDPKDPVLKDALKIMPATVRDYMANAVGTDQEFFVRRDMLFDAFGYRAASVGDAWTGNSRFSDETQKTFQRVAIGVMGNKAFSLLTNGEKVLSNFMSDARTTIVVKSVIVPVMNLVSNMVQLKSRGVPLTDILKKSHSKTIEVNAYVKNRLRQVDAEAELRAAVGTNAVLKLEAEIQSLKDAQRRLTIWPLIEAGEFTAISDVGVMHDDVDLSQGRWHEFIEKQVDKLPDAIRNAGRYAYITKDTALFQGLQKAVQYGDFLAKSIMFDDLVLRKGMKPDAAMAMITEEFVNYDRLPGRFRGYMEQVGLLWFYNFKLRSTKVAASMLRNNPVHALVTSLLPVPDVFGPVGSPIEDNFLTKAMGGTLGYSIGPGMGLRAPSMNPWWTLVN